MKYFESTRSHIHHMELRIGSQTNVPNSGSVFRSVFRRDFSR